MEKKEMTCDECGGPVVTERNAVRRYDIGELPHVELHGVEVTHCPSCGMEGIVIPRIAQLHRVLAETFVTQRRMLAPVEVRFLRKHLGMSTSDFAKRIGVSRETVSRWETGAQGMGSVADRLVRLLVLTHEPTEDYLADDVAVDDVLLELDDTPAPAKLHSLPLWNRKNKGWTPEESPAHGSALAGV